MTHESKMIRRTILRLAAAAVLVLGLGAPSPGYTGGCGANGGGVADPVQYCVSKEAAVCARECSTGRYTPEMCGALCANDDQIISRCAGNSWPPGCAPTQAAANACISALRLESLRDVPSGSITECMASVLCGSGSALTSADEPEGI